MAEASPSGRFLYQQRCLFLHQRTTGPEKSWSTGQLPDHSLLDVPNLDAAPMTSVERCKSKIDAVCYHV
jgi:hypothetical protein